MTAPAAAAGTTECDGVEPVPELWGAPDEVWFGVSVGTAPAPEVVVGMGMGMGMDMDMDMDMAGYVHGAETES